MGPHKNVSWEDAGGVEDMMELKAKLAQALRENAMLSEVIGKDTRLVRAAVGHRTVSSTQLASTFLTGQQKMEVAEMVRRQENLRQQTIDSYEQQIMALGTECERAVAEVERAEKLRLQDNKSAATEMQDALASWNAERGSLQSLSHTSAVGGSRGPSSPCVENKLAVPTDNSQGIPVNRSLSFENDAAVLVAELRKKLKDGKSETDAQLQRVLEIDEASFTWCIQESGPRAVSALSATMAKEHTLLTSAAKIDMVLADQLWSLGFSP